MRRAPIQTLGLPAGDVYRTAFTVFSQDLLSADNNYIGQNCDKAQIVMVTGALGSTRTAVALFQRETGSEVNGRSINNAGACCWSDTALAINFVG